MLANVRAPVIALFDRDRREFVLREHGEPRETGQLAPELFDGPDPDESPALILSDRLRARLVAEQPVFR
ncbi:hypothetical protein OG223_07985 [Streptomyces sp. NBC_01478]|uniref:hypothetical protein n=1 Tax=Streptomyces sp. NBC_01478 TaxID=2903882 RepID=UPI002E3577E4|nr:hypothetical protein [Streptomyces sp. NBC_01478]